MLIFYYLIGHMICLQAGCTHSTMMGVDRLEMLLYFAAFKIHLQDKSLKINQPSFVYFWQRRLYFEGGEDEHQDRIEMAPFPSPACLWTEECL